LFAVKKDLSYGYEMCRELSGDGFLDKVDN
jgi:hypothetical protein